MPQNTYNTTIGFEWKSFSTIIQFYGVNNCTRYVELASFSQNLDNVYHQGTFWSKSNMTADSPLPRWTHTWIIIPDQLFIYMMRHTFA